jgi:hypothetical protein
MVVDWLGRDISSGQGQTFMQEENGSAMFARQEEGPVRQGDGTGSCSVFAGAHVARRVRLFREMLMLSFRRTVWCSIGAIAALALTSGIASASSITYQVTTAGCFNCTTAGPFTQVASDSGYSFEGVSSNDVTDASGNATVSLGMLTRDNNNYSQSATGSDFVLQVTFLNPIGMSKGADTFVATIVGTQGQPGDLDFDQTFTTYTFANQLGSGSFDFRVNDILGLNKNDSANLTGTIQNATFTPTLDLGSSASTAAVPEPATLLLLGSGLFAVARGLRRRASK